jgi:hypothetical protein
MNINFIRKYLPRISLFKYGSRLHVHGRNCFKSVTFKTGSPRSIHNSNLRPLRSSSKSGSFDVGINGLILKNTFRLISYNDQHTYLS